MKHKGKQAGERFWRIENEILIPFVIIGILVLIAFGAVSCYNSYHIKMDYEKIWRGRCSGMSAGISISWRSGWGSRSLRSCFPSTGRRSFYRR